MSHAENSNEGLHNAINSLKEEKIMHFMSNIAGSEQLLRLATYEWCLN